MAAIPTMQRSAAALPQIDGSMPRPGALPPGLQLPSPAAPCKSRACTDRPARIWGPAGAGFSRLLGGPRMAEPDPGGRRAGPSASTPRPAWLVRMLTRTPRRIVPCGRGCQLHRPRPGTTFALVGEIRLRQIDHRPDDRRAFSAPTAGAVAFGTGCRAPADGVPGPLCQPQSRLAGRPHHRRADRPPIKLLRGAAIRARVTELLGLVGIVPATMPGKRPHQFLRWPTAAHLDRASPGVQSVLYRPATSRHPRWTFSVQAQIINLMRGTAAALRSDLSSDLP